MVREDYELLIEEEQREFLLWLEERREEELEDMYNEMSC